MSAACKEGQAAMAARLLKRLAAASPRENLVFSPLSIHAALALAAAGARGRTLHELLAVLGAPSLDALAEFVGHAMGHTLADRSASGAPCVAFACGAWCDASQPLRPAYRDAVVGTYRATAATVDFRNNPGDACKAINAWVAELTRNLITTVVHPHPGLRDTAVVLANAIYFKGQWWEPFDPEDTRDRKFRLLGGGSVRVPFMRTWSHQYIACHDGFKVLKLHYKMKDGDNSYGFDDESDTDSDSDESDASKRPCKRQKKRNSASPGSDDIGSSTEKELQRFCMCVFLPDARDGLPALVDRMASDEGFVLRHLPKVYVPVGKFRLPRFNLSFDGSVHSVLRELGLRRPFDPRKADLSGMVEDDDGGRDRRPVFVRDVCHRAILEVDEEGSEAAAHTIFLLTDETSSGVSSSKPRKRVDFVADHPFAFFLIEETSGAVVFAGQVMDPSAEDF
ncbi:hypothetical protein ACP70R_003716 [Stipagrostis hirtigluma subsp. patula]